MASAEFDGERVVVAVDGSEASKAALHWAVRYGRKTGATVRAVTVWRAGVPFQGGMPASEESYEQQARANLEATLGEIRTSGLEIPVEARLERGEPVTVLVEQAQQAELLVFGGKGYNPVSGMIAGSLITRSLHHAPCPVVIVGQQQGPGPH
ncbi:universal stress protein [Haloactinomyces albus]|uniref:Nucleotide-binding universal stress UspA family protein n=1 Tax=Haloactinomyces albus TaxID=1352928 RepID=A0AAE4CMH5_9ACTN|nr:universal stress protein [Haloactinomyces albus]MDR7303385.1 nucleotide-binding universal stress UspA family protein [Haloactinomyces albus]